MILPARYFALAVTALAVTSLSNCSSTPEVPEDRTLDNRAWWSGDGVEGSRKIVIDLSAQRLRYYKGGKLVGMSPISSGREGNSTLNGNFSVLDKDIDHRSSLYGAFVDGEGSIVQEDVDSRKDRAPAGSKFMGASMRYFMRIVGGIGMHEGYLPGYPASHGCIRLPTRMAEIFFHETPPGTPVQVVGHGTLAVTEEAVPLGKGQVAAQEPGTDDDDEDGDDDDEPRTRYLKQAKYAQNHTAPQVPKYPPQQPRYLRQPASLQNPDYQPEPEPRPETIRRAVAAKWAEGRYSSSSRFQPARTLRKKYKNSGTLIAE
ncbi:MAG: L,D-transpeptidase family protein [Prosthecobacter sp.]